MSPELDSSLLMGKMVNGYNATNDEVKYMASIQINERATNRPNVPVWKHYCGAGIIGSRFLLTAAQCIHYIVLHGGQNYIDAAALVGTIFLSTGERRINIQHVVQHRSYSHNDPESDTKNDYGVILVSISISYDFMITFLLYSCFQ